MTPVMWLVFYPDMTLVMPLVFCSGVTRVLSLYDPRDVTRVTFPQLCDSCMVLIDFRDMIPVSSSYNRAWLDVRVSNT